MFNELNVVRDNLMNRYFRVTSMLLFIYIYVAGQNILIFGFVSMKTLFFNKHFIIKYELSFR